MKQLFTHKSNLGQDAIDNMLNLMEVQCDNNVKFIELLLFFKLEDFELSLRRLQGCDDDFVLFV